MFDRHVDLVLCPNQFLKWWRYATVYESKTKDDSQHFRSGTALLSCGLHAMIMFTYAMIVWLVSEMRSNSFPFLSLHQCTCLKNVRQFEHWVLAGDKFAYHPEIEFVPFTVSKLVRWSFLIICPGLFRSWTTETPITQSEYCCVTGHFSRKNNILKFNLHLLTFPVGDVVEHVREDDPVWKNLRCVPGHRHEFL